LETTKKLITVLTPTYNEEHNVRELYLQIKKIFEELNQYTYEHMFIDNASTDDTVPVLKSIAEQDKNIKIIVNSRNFGSIRSHYYGLMHTSGDAIISIAADFQEPPELIRTFIKKWEEGYKIVVAVKHKSKENPVMFMMRRFYYFVIHKLSEIEQIRNFNGFGLYDRQVITILRDLKDPYPYFRGIIADIGFKRAEVEYVQPVRKNGKSKNNFYALYDTAMLGFISHSKLPLRLATFIGFGAALMSLLTAIVYFFYKLLYWHTFPAGIAPLVIGLFFFSSVQLFFIGVIGEYIGVIFTQIKNRPLVIEKERINF
jgi:glycosyltransferase involved in cell wall biosynthesis